MDRYLFNLGKGDAEKGIEARSDEVSYLKGYNETRMLLNSMNTKFKICPEKRDFKQGDIDNDTKNS